MPEFNHRLKAQWTFYNVANKNVLLSVAWIWVLMLNFIALFTAKLLLQSQDTVKPKTTTWKLFLLSFNLNC